MRDKNISFLTFCLFFSLLRTMQFSTGSCRWIHSKFRHHSLLSVGCLSRCPSGQAQYSGVRLSPRRLECEKQNCRGVDTGTSVKTKLANHVSGGSLIFIFNLFNSRKVLRRLVSGVRVCDSLESWP